MKSVITKSDNGVFSIRKSDFSEAGVEFVLSERAYIIFEDCEFDFKLYSFNNGIAVDDQEFSFQLYDVNGKSAVLIEIKADEQFSDRLSYDFMELDHVRFMCQSLIHSKYPGIDINSYHVGDISTHIDSRVSIVIGSSTPVVEFESGY